MGAGAHWFRHLCYCLENNTVDNTENDLNFHNKMLSNNVQNNHFYEHYDILLSSKYKFNLFLNAIMKTEGYDIPNNWFENAVHYINHSRWHKSKDWEKDWGTNIDIDLSLIVNDPKQFKNLLFNLLDKYNLKFSRNENLVDIKIKQFVETCPNPIDHIGNLNDKYWQVWCLGFMPVEKVRMKYNNAQEIVDILKENNDHYIKITPYFAMH